MHQDDSIHEEAVHDRRASDRGLGGKVLTIEQRLAQGDKRMGNIEVSIAEVLEIVTMGKSFFKVLGWIGKGIRWTVAIAAPCVALYYAWKNGGPTGPRKAWP